MVHAAARRSATIVVVALLACLAHSFAAVAVGVAGVELRMDLPERDGRRLVEVGDQSVTVTYSLENLTSDDVTVRLYAAEAIMSDAGGVSIGAADTAPFLGLDDGEVIVPAGETLAMETVIDPTRLPDDDLDERNGAIVIEAVDTGDTLVTRAAIVIGVTGDATQLLPGTLAIAAITVLVLTLGAVSREMRVRRRRQAPGRALATT